MGPLIQMTTSRQEAAKLDQNEESRVSADVGGNGYFQLKKPQKDGVQMAERVLWVAKPSPDPKPLVSPRRPN